MIKKLIISFFIATVFALIGAWLFAGQHFCIGDSNFCFTSSP